MRTDVPPREKFLALCAAEAWEARACVLSDPPAWCTLTDGAVATAVWRATWRLHCRVGAQVHETAAQLAQLHTLLAQVHTAQADLLAAREAALVAGDDLDVFQAGYERGYAQGWKHREAHGAASQQEGPEHA